MTTILERSVAALIVLVVLALFIDIPLWIILGGFVYVFGDLLDKIKIETYFMGIMGVGLVIALYSSILL